MHKYRLVRTGSDFRVFVDGNPKTTVDANKRNEMRDCMASAGLAPDEINQKVSGLDDPVPAQIYVEVNFRPPLTAGQKPLL